MIQALLTQDRLPDFLIRWRIRHLLQDRLREEAQGGVEGMQTRFRALLETFRSGPIAVHTADANEQHYEVPPAFFAKALGPRMKYSCALYPTGGESLEAAEVAMLELTCRRAGLADGQKILELGCGWGSLSLWMAEHYPNAQITAVSNSRDQRLHIEGKARERGLTNLHIITADMNAFEPPEMGFDRVVSVEMFEHMRNHDALLRRVAAWLCPGGQLFVHVFVHAEATYPFEVRDDNDWMAKYFFTGGIMPSDSYLLRFQNDLKVIDHWRVNGTHYARTARAWLRNQDYHRQEILDLFEKVYGEQALERFVYWRIFFMACEELWAWNQGNTWSVSHYLFERPQVAST
ncbi:MAG: class I SAM-dependent methyltransferase [Holophaga sp.]|nr:class I SAM-dependent methyltransferase [Holophaga sp.]